MSMVVAHRPRSVGTKHPESNDASTELAALPFEQTPGSACHSPVGGLTSARVPVRGAGCPTEQRKREWLRLQFIQLRDARRDIAQLIGQLGDAVQRVKQRPQCPARWDVETVWLPIKVVVQRPEEVVEVRDLVTPAAVSRPKTTVVGAEAYPDIHTKA
jgi:hypothetical protein